MLTAFLYMYVQVLDSCSTLTDKPHYLSASHFFKTLAQSLRITREDGSTFARVSLCQACPSTVSTPKQEIGRRSWCPQRPLCHICRGGSEAIRSTCVIPEASSVPELALQSWRRVRFRSPDWRYQSSMQGRGLCVTDFSNKCSFCCVVGEFIDLISVQDWVCPILMC